MHARLLERERIAGELRDTLLQGIHALLLQMQSVLQGLSDEQARRALEGAIEHAEHAEQAVAQARDRIAGLRDKMNLPDNVFVALKVLANALAANGQTEVRVSQVGVQQPLRLDVRDEVLYIAREAIVNALRHADAQRIDVTVEFSLRGFALAVADDGCGLPPRWAWPARPPATTACRACARARAGYRRDLPLSIIPGFDQQNQRRPASCSPCRHHRCAQCAFDPAARTHRHAQDRIAP